MLFLTGDTDFTELVEIVKSFHKIVCTRGDAGSLTLDVRCWMLDAVFYY
jgi:hypothetical protein